MKRLMKVGLVVAALATLNGAMNAPAEARHRNDYNTYLNQVAMQTYYQQMLAKGAVNPYLNGYGYNPYAGYNPGFYNSSYYGYNAYGLSPWQRIRMQLGL